MPFRYRRKESVAKGLRRIAREQVDRALAEIDDSALSPHEVVHQVRKRCKKLRGLVRLVRPSFDGYRKANATFRDAARDLSYLRDAHAIIETVDDLIEHFGEAADTARFQAVRDALIARREHIVAEDHDVAAKLANMRESLAAARQGIRTWSLSDSGDEAWIGGLAKTFKRGRKAMHRARRDPTSEHFHEWRKRAKYHWHHARLLKQTWPELLRPYAKHVKLLSDLIGDEHDLAVLRDILLSEPKRFGPEADLQAFIGLLDVRRAQLQSQALRLGERIYAPKPKALAAQWACYWQTWRAPRPKFPISTDELKQ